MASQKFGSKLDVLDAMKGVQANAQFHWFPKLWENYDYTKISDKSYEQLKLERALKLREKYKYLKLYFSGGSDSITVLNTFIKNNIHIDEIVNWKRSLGSFQKLDPNIENELSAIPYLNYIQHSIPKTKITIENISITDLMMYNNGLGSGKENRRIIFGDPSELDFVPDHKYLYLNDTRDGVGHIEGGQKPSIFLYNNQWYFGMYDTCCTGFYNNAEDFFFDKENPELFIKTVHNLTNYMNNLFLTDTEKFENLKNNRNNRTVRAELLPIVGRDTVYNIVSLIKFHFNQFVSPVLKYDGKNIKYPYIRTYEVIKSLINQNALDDNIRTWNDNMAQLTDRYAESIKLDQYNEPHTVIGFQPTLSNLYNLNDKNDVVKLVDPSKIQHKIIVL